MRVAFDCDGTLVGYDGQLRKDICRLLIGFICSDAQVVVWSGGGKDYARSVYSRVVKEFNLDETVLPEKWMGVECTFKDKSKPDLVFDDEHVVLGKVNVCVREAVEDLT